MEYSNKLKIGREKVKKMDFWNWLKSLIVDLFKVVKENKEGGGVQDTSVVPGINTTTTNNTVVEPTKPTTGQTSSGGANCPKNKGILDHI